MDSSLKQTGNSENSNTESPAGPALMVGFSVIFIAVLGFMLYNDALVDEYNEGHTYVKCWNTGGYVCTQDWFGGCARYEPQTKCQRYRKQGSPTFDEWKPARDR